MSNSSRDSPDSQAARRTVIVAGTVLVFSLGALGGTFYLQKRETAPDVLRGFSKDPDKRLVAEVDEIKRKKILEMREKWQLWALKHKPELKRMLRAEPRDRAALLGVSSLIPLWPKKEEAGISDEDWPEYTLDTKFSNFQTILYSWTHGGTKAAAIASPKTVKSVNETKLRVKSLDEAMFMRLRDVTIVSASSARSNKQYFLWASGRVTETASAFPVADPHREIAPPYDFLDAPPFKA